MSERRLYPGTHAAERPDAAALIHASTGEVVTWRQLDERSNRIAHLLHGAGLRRGDGIAVVSENHLRCFDLVWAALRSGLYYTLVNSTLTASEAADVLDASRAQVLVASTGRLSLAGEAGADVAAIRRRLVFASSADAALELPPGWESLEAEVEPVPASPLADEPEGAPLWFSSGTSGRPKGVVRPLPDVPGDPVAMHYATAYGLDEGTVHLCLGPLHHAAPIGFSTAVHRLGGTVVLTERFDPEEVLATIERHRVTFSHMVPTMFVRMLKLPAATRGRFDVSSLRRVIHGAAPCPVGVKRQLIEWWGPIVEEYYGGTEGVGSTMITAAEWLAHPGSVGRASRGVIHIADEDGVELPVGEDGMVWFENPSAVTSYLGDAEQTAAVTHPAGWQTLGDIGHVDEEGYLFLTDRWVHKIVTGGVNVFPREVEDVLIGHPSVLDVAVIGVPDDDKGERVHAVVQPVDAGEATPALAEELLELCRRSLAAYKCPRSVEFDPALPRQENGKLYKRLIRDRYWVGHTSGIV